MKKKLAILILCAITSVSFVSCAQKSERSSARKVKNADAKVEKKEKTPEININSVSEICELVTLRVEFTEVAKGVKPSATGIKGWNQDDRKYWVEFSGYAELSIDMKKVEYSSDDDGKTIRVSIPDPEIKTFHVYDDKYGDPILEGVPWYKNTNEIDTEDINKLVAESEDSTKQAILEDEYYTKEAKNIAEDLIKNYIETFNKENESEYKAEFK